ncbi:MAG: 50S ribosomal protein L25 [Chloroflexi bacterium]|nr:MAG: 50S ribosomal protein L25 [Chloroflexota bacterium]
MEQIELRAEKRDILGKKVKRIRKQGLVPGIIYGPQIDPIPIQVDSYELLNVLRRAGANRLITLKIKGERKPHLTLARTVQRDVITRNLIHVDFQEVVLTETITTQVPIHLEGTPDIVERGEAIINQALDSIEIEALPTDLIPAITIDISGLEEIDDAVFVRDLELPEQVTILTDPDEMIVRIGYAEMEREEAEEEIAEEEVEVEVVPEEAAVEAPEEAKETEDSE